MLIRTIVLSLLLASPALAQPAPGPQKQGDDTLRKAGSIARQPARDIGIEKEEIPAVLQKAVQNPYAAPPSRSCSGLQGSLTELNAVLGDDFVVGKDANENRTGKIAEAVGRTVVNSLIPFRGLVREISGAAPAERRLQGAVAAGVARRGYLRGLAAARGCKISTVAPPVVGKK